MKLNNILMEASYNQMLQMKGWERIYEIIGKGVNVAFEKHQRELNDDLREAKKRYKKEDRIVFLMRHWIFSSMANIFDDLIKNIKVDSLTAEDFKELHKLINKEISKYKAKTSHIAEYDAKTMTITYNQHIISLMTSEMNHYMSLDIPAIQAHVFDSREYEYHSKKLNDIETKWQETRKRFIQDDPDMKVLIDMGKFKWFDLEGASCDLEGDAMGHCGNSPSSGDTNQTIYSLREEKIVNGSVWWKPHATFIYHKKEKGLGEMKGFANENPDEKIHKYIIELLLHKNIQTIIGGGYQAYKNFSIRDLTDSQKSVIGKKKPQLLNLIDRVEIGGVDALRKEFKDDNQSLIMDDHFIVLQFDDFEEMIDDIGDDMFDNYSESLTGDGLEFEFYDASKDDIELYLSTQNASKLKSAWLSLDPDEEYDDWHEFFRDNDDTEFGDVIQSLDGAYNSSLQSGAEGELHDAVKSSIEDATIGLGEDGNFKLLYTNNKWDMDSKNFIGISMDSIYDFIQTDELEDYSNGEVNSISDLSDVISEHLDYQGVELKLSVPYNGFGGFDEEYFNELAFEQANL